MDNPQATVDSVTITVETSFSNGKTIKSVFNMDPNQFEQHMNRTIDKVPDPDKPGMTKLIPRKDTQIRLEGRILEDGDGRRQGG